MSREEVLKVLNVLDTPLLLLDASGHLHWVNQAAKMTVFEGIHLDSWNEDRNLPDGFSYVLHKDAFESDLTMIECLRLPEGPDERTIWELRQENTELAELINSSLDEWYITDGEGITLQVNDKVEQLYGSLVGGLVGKSVFELEQKRIFYPSVTAMVLRHRTQQTVLQSTVDGRRLVSTGNAIFNENGTVKRVISYAKDVTELELLTANHRSAAVVERSDTRANVAAQLVSNSPSMQSCMRLASRVARTEAAVMISGETGVGKNRVAKYVHESSHRAGRPFVEINCASIPESLIESELFGYERGSFTGARREGKAGKVELAEGGTLFLNEIGELPLHLQGKLLDLVQERRIERIGATSPTYVDTRILTATNRNLRDMVEVGTFREDLYYRLHVVEIEIPPLRDRPEDITPLIDVYLERFTRQYGGVSFEITEDAMSALTTYQWPGNIRELENMVEYLVITSEDKRIDLSRLPQVVRSAHSRELVAQSRGQFGGMKSATGGRSSGLLETPEKPWKAHMERTEYEIYSAALERARNTRELAEHLGVSQSTVVRKLKQFGLSLSR
ncbi:sigma-54 interaction domain-containing protein [Alicyclobacillus sp. ALC3]|uniref:sigma-54 interaction domain-containing protein n=1 Tax=Alicyclobacillus sp. ALC3 TaxID=2796143 RepID=UPI002379430D|nr:sigma 54-interacting transcriptional regulator [Alicyclobacillus sp. ALC3]WDL99082.1 sigma 54-interacting transcriptional regulator [Alicyclobacillus sp. ALC3]